MRLISIDIENFGKLSDVHINMSENPVVIMESNGWGKSTLAAFVRVMFYGFMDESKKKTEEKERYMRKPWNNGIYGGSIVFEYKGRQYRLDRTFGAKASEDKGRIVDNVTRLECDYFDINALGEQLFGINAEAYIRTLFLGQNNLSVRNDKEKIDDSITAKIGNLTEATDDINKYEKVMDKLQKVSNSLKSGNKKGEINLLNTERNGLFSVINMSMATEEGLENAMMMQQQLKDEKMRYAAKAKALDEEYAKAGMRESTKAQRKLKEELEEEKNRHISEANAVLATYIDRIPDENEVDDVIIKINEYVGFKEKCESLRSLINTVREENATEKIPGEEAANIQLNNIKRRNECINRIRELDDRRMLDMNILDMKKQLWRQEEDRKDEKIKDAIRQCRNGIVIAVVVMCIFVAVFTGVGIILSKNAFICLDAVAFVIAAVAVSVILRNRSRKITEIEAAFDATGPNCTEEELQIEKTREMRQVHTDKLEQLERQIESFCREYGLINDESLEETLCGFISRAGDNSRSTQIKEQYGKAVKDAEERKAWLDRWFERVCFVTDNMLETAVRIKKDIIRIGELKRAVRDCDEKISHIDEAVETNSHYDNALTIEEIAGLKEELEEKCESLGRRIRSNEDSIKELIEKKDRIDEAKQNLCLIDDKLEECQHKYDIIKKTMSFLQNAKESLSSRYIDPIGDAFIKYYSYITTEFIDDYEVDANIKLTRQEQGHRRDVSSLSRGYKDLIDISLRMALIDVMYEGEKPWIILDDPFVNLDTNKLAGVRKFIDCLSDEYQIIYFTCHESRA